MHGLELLIWVVLILLVVGPILGIVAWVKVRRLERESRQPDDLSRVVARIYELEKRQARMEEQLAQLSSQGVPAAEPQPTQEAPVKPREVAPPPPPSPATVPPPAMPAQPPSRPAPPPAASPTQPIDYRPMFTASPSATEPVAPAPVSFASEKSGSSMDLESLIGGRWLYFAGLALVLVAGGFFIKLAIDNEWIGPTGQVAIGILFGASLFGLSHWMLGRGYKYFSEGITGLGAGMLYLSLWGGCNYYHLFSQTIAFFAMIAVTGATLAIAVGRDSQRIALLALLGGFLTPWLASTGRNAQIELFTYLAVLDAGLLALARLRQWRWLESPAFLFTQIYFWGWYDRFYDATQLPSTMGFAALLFLMFTVLPAIRSRQTAAMYPEQAALLFTNAFLYLVALRQMLWPEQKWMLTIAVLLLAALHLYIARFVPRRDGERPVAYFLYAGMALTFVTLAIPIRLEGKWITMAWAAEGALLAWSGFRTRMWQLRAAAFLLFLLAVFRLVAFPMHANVFLLNARFATFAVVVASLAAAVYFWRQHREEVRTEEQPLFAALAVAANVLALWGLSMEVHLFFTAPPSGVFELRWHAQVLMLTAFWFVYAAGLLGTGLVKRIAGLRYQGYVLFALALAKLLFGDIPAAGGAQYDFFAFNPRFAAFAVMVGCLALVLGLARRESEALQDAERTFMKILGVAINVVALWGLSLEVYQLFLPPPGIEADRDIGLAQQMGLSLLWTVYATALVLTGMRRGRQGLRYQGLVLFGITIIKVFFFDLGYLSGIYRVASSFALGVLLLVVAFIYQKVLAAKSRAETP